MSEVGYTAARDEVCVLWARNTIRDVSVVGVWQPGTIAAKQMIPKPTAIYFALEPAICITAWGQLVLRSIRLKQQQHLFCSRFCNLVSVRWAPFLSVPRGVSWDGSGAGAWNHLKAHCFLSGPELGSPKHLGFPGLLTLRGLSVCSLQHGGFEAAERFTCQLRDLNI